MNAPVKQSLLVQSVAAEHIAKCREILSSNEMTGEQFALSEWWAGQRLFERAAFYQLAGINRYNSHSEWMQLPEHYRAALALAFARWREKLAGIDSTLRRVRGGAVRKLREVAPVHTQKDAAA
ncbi:MAG: hypothetical protein Q8J78_08890 [Moraxellaceae bacterium]|nr:hypothetical protein [Moraxellaceae bacterium]